LLRPVIDEPVTLPSVAIAVVNRGAAALPAPRFSPMLRPAANREIENVG
jgi:hypothetical protein